jgi:hypothetical protein
LAGRVFNLPHGVLKGWLSIFLWAFWCRIVSKRHLTIRRFGVQLAAPSEKFPADFIEEGVLPCI